MLPSRAARDARAAPVITTSPAATMSWADEVAHRRRVPRAVGRRQMSQNASTVPTTSHAGDEAQPSREQVRGEQEGHTEHRHRRDEHREGA